MQMYIVLGTLIFMIVMFFIHKVPYGVITMTCCAVLALTGVLDLQTAFSGLANKTTLLCAGMFTIAMAFGKTSVIGKIRDAMNKVKGKSKFVFLLSLFAVVIILAQLMGRLAIVSIIALFLMTMSDEDEMCPSRILFAAFSVLAIWTMKIPVGAAATMSYQVNALYEGIVNNASYMLQPIDFLKVGIIPCLALTIYALFAWKLIPKHAINTEGVKDVNSASKLSRRDEIITYIVFGGVMIGFFAGTKLGNIMYLLPILGVLVLIYLKVMPVKEAVSGLTSDMVWMIAGVLVMSDAIGKSGVGDLIGTGAQTLLGAHPSSLVVMIVFATITILMTTFMSNTGTMAVMTPIAASYAVVAGMDPRGIILIVNIANALAVAFPSGSAECALTFAITRQNPVSMLKYTLPYIVIAIITLAFSANMFFPVYPS